MVIKNVFESGMNEKKNVVKMLQFPIIRMVSNLVIFGIWSLNEMIVHSEAKMHLFSLFFFIFASFLYLFRFLYSYLTR